MSLITRNFERLRMHRRLPAENKQSRRRRVSDLLIAVALGVAVAAFTYWQIRRGVRRRKRE